MYREPVRQSSKSETRARVASATGAHSAPKVAHQLKSTLTKSVELDFGRYITFKTAMICGFGLCVIIIAALLLTASWHVQQWMILLLIIVVPIGFWLATKPNKAARMNTKLKSYFENDVDRQTTRVAQAETNVTEVFATVLFADIRSFTEMTETADKFELFKELNAYYEVVDEAVTAFGGTINKFGGDSVLALFGATSPHPDHGSAALNAAAAIVEGLAELNQNRMTRHRRPFRIGIGVQTGDMVVGYLGSRNRREYTVLGDCVNVAKRLSDLSKDNPMYSIFVGGTTLDCTKQMPSSLVVDELGETAVRGRHKMVQMYAVTPLISTSRVLPGGYVK